MRPRPRSGPRLSGYANGTRYDMGLNGFLHDTRITVSVAGFLSVGGLGLVIGLVLGLVFGMWVG